ncbi:hypothetical protein Halhy_6649 (plasmid) [Haliscomenobacter hydrossis DSM 1100]|uniref:Uncharacterized protein n=2 Tax=Haliscomenobacter TaxID=2349 RepID=F4L7V7_HALH1|nr:hypothetical protein Halhy_6649 [Haliscomenobacter hydrossis DSM 1100]
MQTQLYAAKHTIHKQEQSILLSTNNTYHSSLLKMGGVGGVKFLQESAWLGSILSIRHQIEKTTTPQYCESCCELGTAP